MRKRFLTTMLVVFVFVGVLAIPAVADAPTVQTVEIDRFDGGSLPPWAEATLVRHDGYVETTVITKAGGELFDLVAGGLGIDWKTGDATTLWFVIFNAPDECTDPCGADDVVAFVGSEFTDNPAGIGLHYATGSVVTSAVWSAAAKLGEGDIDSRMFGEALADAHASEVHLVARSHGSAENLDPADLAAALTSLNGACNINVCGDAQDAVFLPIGG